MPHCHRRSFAALAFGLPLLAGLAGCTTVGSLMSPYSEKFSCKNSDHGQCIHPDKAYADAVNGRTSRSDPAVTNDKKLLRDVARAKSGVQGAESSRTAHRGSGQPVPYLGYRDSVYRELQGLIDAPVTPMMRPGRTVRTLILPYADRERPDRLYMPRYVYSILDRPQWVVGDYLVNPVSSAARAPVLEQVRERQSADDDAADVPAAPQESQP